jgi:phosphoserine phosphatase
MDGTLLRGSSAGLEIARVLGVVEEFTELEADLARGAIDPPGYAARAFGWWERLAVEQVAAAFEAAPWLGGIREVWADIRRRGEYCAVVSLSPSFFVRRLLEWGAHEVRASVFPDVPFAGAELDLSGILLPESKVLVADELCARYGVTRDACVAYGDSLGDAPLFAATGLAVAVNAPEPVRELARFAYTGTDLREAYALVR